jgi:uncharacterized FlaG/YvyC family protein
MESVSGIRPVQTTSQAPVRVFAPQERQVARTELPETKVVNAAARVAETAREAEDQLQAAQTHTKRVVRDDVTKELVFRTVSASTGQVVSQYPDEAVLRDRAYRLNQARQEQLQLSQQKADKVEKLAGVERKV